MIWLVRWIEAFQAYFGRCMDNDVIIESPNFPRHNGDDAIELFKNGNVQQES